MNHLFESLRIGTSAFLMIAGAFANMVLFAGIGKTIRGVYAGAPIGDVVITMALIALFSIACFSLSAWLWGM